MITRIIVGSGSNRVTVPMVRSRDTRRELGSVLKRNLFPTNRDYGQAKRRGQRAMGII